jgi:hypothetical protein
MIIAVLHECETRSISAVAVHTAAAPHQFPPLNEKVSTPHDHHLRQSFVERSVFAHSQ